MDETVVGVISDTHGLLRHEALDMLAGADHILHAGDVGERGILARLEAIAPVTAVRGNVDTEPWCREVLPIDAVAEIGGIRIYMRHIVDELDLDPAAAGFQAVVYGHTHKPAAATRRDVLFFNPGSAGPRRFSLPVSMGRFRIRDGVLHHEFVTLPG